METIKKAIWGDEQQHNSTEPVSGETGAGTVEHPYDAGNAPGIAQSSKGISDGSTGGVPGETPGLGEAESQAAPSAKNWGPHESSIANKVDPRVDSEGDRKAPSGPVGGAASVGALNTYSFGERHDTLNQPRSANYEITTASDHGAGSGHAHHVGGDTGSSSAGLPPVGASTRHETSTLGDNVDYTSAGGAQAARGAVGAGQSLDKTGLTGTHASGITYNDKETSNANASSVADRGQVRAPIGGFGAVEPSVSADPASGATTRVEHQGAARPLDEPGAEHHSGEPLGTVDHSATLDHRQSLVPGNTGIEGPTNTKERGTGEKWIRTSGVAAEGGDFDAAKAGAGKEADRLIVEKGIHPEGSVGEVHDTPGHGHGHDHGHDRGHGDEHDKVGLSQKLKDKLHIGGHKAK